MNDELKTPSQWAMPYRDQPLVFLTTLWLGDTPIFFDLEDVWYSYVVLPQKTAPPYDGDRSGEYTAAPVV